MLRQKSKVGGVVLVMLGIAMIPLLANDSSSLPDWFFAWKSQCEVWVETYPWFYVLAVGMAPIFLLPVSPLLILAGAYGKGFGVALAMLGILLNDILGYFIASHLFRTPIEKLMQKRKIKVPEIDSSDAVRMVFLFRLTPGFPLIFQNYILGLARVPFKSYLLASFPIQLLSTAGFVLFGQALFEGKVGLIITAVCFIIVVGIAAKMVHKRLNQSEA